MYKTKLKKAHLFMIREQRSKFYLLRDKKRTRTMWQQVYSLLF